MGAIGTPRRPLRRGARAALGGAVAALLWGGCSIERDHELLSFFFDGVPPPGSAEAGAPGAPTRRVRGAVAAGAVSGHSAYRERRCTECHGERANFGFVTRGYSDLTGAKCMECHEDALDAPRLHGPVAAGACLFCHVPHVSPHPALLEEGSPALCLRCHQPELDGTLSTPVHADMTRDCLECHHGHGGDDPYYLKPSAPAHAEARRATGPERAPPEPGG